jgi:hypothetical protein
LPSIAVQKTAAKLTPTVSRTTDAVTGRYDPLFLADFSRRGAPERSGRYAVVGAIVGA